MPRLYFTSGPVMRVFLIIMQLQIQATEDIFTFDDLETIDELDGEIDNTNDLNNKSKEINRTPKSSLGKPSRDETYKR